MTTGGSVMGAQVDMAVVLGWWGFSLLVAGTGSVIACCLVSALRLARR